MQLSRQVNIRLSGSDLDTLAEVADTRGLALSELIRIAAIEYAKALRSGAVSVGQTEAAPDRNGARFITTKMYQADIAALAKYAATNEFDSLAEALRAAARRGLVDRGYLVMADGAQPDLEF